MSISFEFLAFMASLIGAGGSIPQIVKILRTKDTQALSYAQYLMSFGSGLLWFCYGLFNAHAPIMFWGTAIGVLAGVILYLKTQNEKAQSVALFVAAQRSPIMAQDYAFSKPSQIPAPSRRKHRCGAVPR